ncbi:MAG: hypothetical protein K2W96_21070 [Gemmataceae bacterium]|nr:hypothetical protein [Gemmataceae bacterium]
MKEPEPDSPFSVCAEEKPSAIEYLKRRRQADARAFREQAALWGSLLVACPSLAAAGAAFPLGPGVLLWATAWALVGGLAGLVSGVLAGWISWSFLRVADPDEAERSVEGVGEWAAGTGYVAFWAGIGTVLGAGYGAASAAGAFPWAVSGSALGAIAAFFTWLAWRGGSSSPSSRTSRRR